MSDARARSPFCRCEQPERAKTRDDVAYCETCDGLLPDNHDELLAMLTRAVARMSRQLDSLTAGGEVEGHPLQPSDSGFSPRDSEVEANEELISPAELGRRLGKSRDWVYAHRFDLGVRMVGAGSRPRLWFVEAKARRLLDQAESPPEAPEGLSRPGRRRRRSQTDLLEVKR
jgi:hypothetical protein